MHIALMATYDETLRKNLDYLMAQHATNPNELTRKIAERFGSSVSQPTIHRIVSGTSKTPRDASLEPVAKFFGVTVGDLRYVDLSQGSANASTARQPIPTEPNARPNVRPILVWGDEDELPADQYAFVPRLTIKTSAGNGKLMWEIEEKGQRQAFRLSFLQRMGIDPERSATVVTEGDSMAPRILDGDSLLVDYKDKVIVDNKVYVFLYHDEWFIKRLFKRPGGGLRVVSDNPDQKLYPEWQVEPEEMQHVEIVGRVKGLAGGVV